MNITSLFYVYKIILVVTFVDDICFSIRLIHVEPVTSNALQLKISSLCKMFT